MIGSDSSNCDFQEALITPAIDLLHEIRFITQQTLSFLLPFVYQVDPYFVNYIDIVH